MGNYQIPIKQQWNIIHCHNQQQQHLRPNSKLRKRREIIYLFVLNMRVELIEDENAPYTFYECKHFFFVSPQQYY